MNPKTLIPVVGLILLFAQPFFGQDAKLDDIEPTRAFLVKLRTGSTTRAGVDDSWQFTPLVSETQTRGEATPVGNWWYLAPRADSTATRSASSSNTDWDAAYDLYTGKIGNATRSSDTRTALGARDVEPDKIEFIEPDIGYFSAAPGSSAAPKRPASATGAKKASAGSPQTKHWPQYENGETFQDGSYSQLKSAREMVEAKMAENQAAPVRVAFLDTGYDPSHVACPPKINKGLARNFVEDKVNPDGISLEKEPGPKGSQSHGTGTIGIFGGGQLEIVDKDGKQIFSGKVGGAPFAEIAPMRVATSVVHLENPMVKTRPSGTTRAILYAIRNKCDVISMSHGGLPSKALADAVNAAYDSGIAMFFASGDYLEPQNGPFHSPRYVVYPAAFPRAMCVCGVTQALKTYGFPPNKTYDASLGSLESWRLRGNWGPATWMKNAIAAFSPNIPWAHLPNPKNHETDESVIDLDGQGTSASTPQAAAAATQWLQYYRDDKRLKDNWTTWQKAELAYAALRSSAKRVNDPNNSNYSTEFFGSGILQAQDALSKKPQELSIERQKEAAVGLGWMRLFTSVVGGTRAEGSSNEILKQMYGLELAQIAQRSVEVQEILERYGGFEPDDNQALSQSDMVNFRKELFRALKNDPRASGHLKEAMSRELAKI